VTPVLVGEFGGINVDSGKEGAWIHTLMSYIRTHGLSYTFWCWNPNSGDTGGLLENDWKTINPAKMALLRTELAPLIGSGQTPPHVTRSEHPVVRPTTSTPGASRVRAVHAVGARRHCATRMHTRAQTRVRTRHTPAASPRPPRHGHAWRSVPVSVRPRVSNGISTAEDDLTLVSPVALYHLRITLSVRRSSPGVDPGEANPQALVQGTLSGHATTSTGQGSSTLSYAFTGLRVPAGSATAAARFDFTSPHQNSNGAHGYGKDSYRVQYATTPGGPPTTMTGSF
jgi:hypothetical protein